MRLKNIVRSTVTGAASLALAIGLGSCSRDYVVAYVYSISGGSPATGGTISAYGVDYQTGIISQIAGSPFALTALSNPSKVIAAPNNKFVYVIGGSQNAQIEEFAVGTDGKLYGEHTYDLTGTEATTVSNGSNALPYQLVGAAIDSAGKFLYVTFSYQSGFSTASPGPGGITIYPIKADGSLGIAFTQKVGNNPVSIAVSSPVCVPSAILAGSASTACNSATGNSSAGFDNVYVYVLDQEITAAKPTILGFAQNQATGTLTPLAGTNLTTLQGYHAGVLPSAIAVDGTTRFVYVTDEEQNEILGYSIARTTTGDLTPLVGSPFGTGQLPVGITIDPRAQYVYTANFNSSTISSFAIAQATGNLSTVSGSTFTTSTGPTCVTIDPALGQFVYVSNYQDNSISGGQLQANTGVVNAIIDTPFPTGASPTCLTSVANGSHSTQSLTP